MLSHYHSTLIIHVNIPTSVLSRYGFTTCIFIY